MTAFPTLVPSDRMHMSGTPGFDLCEHWFPDSRLLLLLLCLQDRSCQSLSCFSRAHSLCLALESHLDSRLLWVSRNRRLVQILPGLEVHHGPHDHLLSIQVSWFALVPPRQGLLARLFRLNIRLFAPSSFFLETDSRSAPAPGPPDLAQ